jgi:hypothetical protein
MLVGVSLISLILLGGRTSLFSYLIGLFLISLNYKKFKLNINKSLLGIILLIAIILVIIVIFQRGGGGGFVGDQARYLALFIFVNILENSSIENLLFGYGFGNYYDFFIDSMTEQANENLTLIQAHSDQIKRSSSVNHYVSWGFHNSIIRIFLTLGIFGSLLFYVWQVSLFYIRGDDKMSDEIIILRTILKIAFILTIILSFSNGIYNINLVGSGIFFLQGYLYGEINFIKKRNFRLSS